jgi:hypothetical protein
MTPGDGSLPFVKPEDYQFFAPLMEEKEESEMTKVFLKKIHILFNIYT